MSGLSKEMKLRNYSKYLTPDHLYLMAYWANRISKQVNGSVEAEELIQECWLKYGRYNKSIKGCSYAIRAHMWHKAQRFRPRGCGLFIKINPTPEINHIIAFDESEEYRLL